MTELRKQLNAVMRAMVTDDPAALEEIRDYLQSQGGQSECQDVRDHIARILLDLGVPCYIKGYRYLATAIEAVVADPDMIYGITKELYPLVAKAHSTTASRAERAIRHAVECGWGRGGLDTMMWYFGNTVDLNKGKPTNSEFISLAANVVRQRLGTK